MFRLSRLLCFVLFLTLPWSAMAQDGWRVLSPAEVQEIILGKLLRADTGSYLFTANGYYFRDRGARYARGPFTGQMLADGRLGTETAFYQIYERRGAYQMWTSDQNRFISIRPTGKTEIPLFPQKNRLSTAEIEALYGRVLDVGDLWIRLNDTGTYDFLRKNALAKSTKGFSLTADGELRAKGVNMIFYRKRKQIWVFNARDGSSTRVLITERTEM